MEDKRIPVNRDALMTQEDKNLLLKDLCARLPYGVIIKSISGDDYGPAIDICYPQGVVAYMGQKTDAYTEEFLPYLRPLSSMTLVEKIELKAITKGAIQTIGLEDIVVTTDKGFDYLNAHHFDYRGLITMGLALEAPEDMYKTE